MQEVLVAALHGGAPAIVIILLVLAFTRFRMSAKEFSIGFGDDKNKKQQ